MSDTPMSGQRRRKPKEEFYSGVLCAMAVIRAFDAETEWRKIARDCGGYDYLRRLSKKNGNLDIDGFTRYRREADHV